MKTVTRNIRLQLILLNMCPSSITCLWYQSATEGTFTLLKFKMRSIPLGTVTIALKEDAEPQLGLFCTDNFPIKKGAELNHFSANSTLHKHMPISLWTLSLNWKGNQKASDKKLDTSK